MQVDFDDLRERVLRRLYPETLPVLGLYWLKTVYARGYGRPEWHALAALLQTALASEFAVESPSRQMLLNLQSRVHELCTEETRPRSHHSPGDAARPPLHRETLLPYLVRLLNEWLPVEVANMLIQESEWGTREPGIPPTAMARALERLLTRERLSESTFQALLKRDLLSPRLIYPADSEILRDVLLYLLGRTHAVPPPVMPAMLVCVAPGAPLAVDYGEAVEQAYLAQGSEGEELRVPIAPEQTMQILSGNDVRLASLVVTMDGRWWQSGKLKSGDENAVVYRPGGLLRFDYSADHARLRVPWPETRQRWSGPVSFTKPIQLFGREWRVARWEQEGEDTWLHLVFVHTLSVSAATESEMRLRRSRPASVDMAWAAMEIALAASVAQRTIEPIEQLRQEELIPLGRALFWLAECMAGHRSEKGDTIETRLRAVGYHGGELLATYGRVPWRILPGPLRKGLSRLRQRAPFSEMLEHVFDGLPETRSETPRKHPLAARSLRSLLQRKPPSQAA